MVEGSRLVPLEWRWIGGGRARPERFRDFPTSGAGRDYKQNFLQGVLPSAPGKRGRRAIFLAPDINSPPAYYTRFVPLCSLLASSSYFLPVLCFDVVARFLFVFAHLSHRITFCPHETWCDLRRGKLHTFDWWMRSASGVLVWWRGPHYTTPG